MTKFAIFFQQDDDPRRNGKRRFIRRYNDDGSSDVVATDVPPDVATVFAAAHDLMALVLKWDNELACSASFTPGGNARIAEQRKQIAAALAKAEGRS